MSEKKGQENEEYSFIREKIKETPERKQPKWVRFIQLVAAAVVFGLIAGVVFAAVNVRMEQILQEEEHIVSIPKDEISESEDSTNVKDTQENGQNAGTDAENTNEQLTDQKPGEPDTNTQQDGTDGKNEGKSEEGPDKNEAPAQTGDQPEDDKKNEADSSKDNNGGASEPEEGSDQPEDAEPDNKEGTGEEGSDSNSEGIEQDGKSDAEGQKLGVAEYQKLYQELFQIAEEANRSVVTITSVTSDTDWFNNPYESEGQTSGLIFAQTEEEILILTEYKAVAEAVTLRVTFVDDEVTQASLKRYDGNTGLTVLAVPVYGLKKSTLNAIKTAELGNSYQTKQGDSIIALGSPTGYNYSVAYGMVTSVKNLVYTTDANYNIMTTDILGNAEGSGVLINFSGQVVGIILQEYSTKYEQDTVTALGISEVKDIVETLSNDMDIAYFGIRGRNVTASIAEEMGLPMGVYVNETLIDSPAMNAGVQSGDIIVQFNGVDIKSIRNLKEELIRCHPDDMVSVTVMREGMDEYQNINFNIRLSVLTR